MAQLYVNTVTASSFRWSIQSLGSVFTSTNYSSVGISTRSFTSGTSTRPSVLTYTQDYTGTTSTNTTTFYHNLSAGTHTLYGFASSGGKYYSCGSVTITVPSSDTIAPTIGNVIIDVPSHGYVNTTTFTANITVTDNVSVANVTCVFNGKVYTYGSKSGSTYYFRLDTPTSGATRTLKFTATDTSGNSRSSSSSVWCCYDATPPTFSYVEAISKDGGIQVGCTVSDTLSGTDRVYYRISTASTSTTAPEESAFSNLVTLSSSDNHYVYTQDANGNNLIVGKKYWIQFTALDRAGNYSNKKYVACTVKATKPGIWTWDENELNAFNKKEGYGTNSLTWQRWNEFVVRVAEFARWKIGEDYTKFDLGNALMTANDKVLTANRFNKVRYAIGSMNATGIEAVNKGDFVFGWYFITLSDKLNGIT